MDVQPKMVIVSDVEYCSFEDVLEELKVRCQRIVDTKAVTTNYQDKKDVHQEMKLHLLLLTRKYNQGLLPTKVKSDFFRYCSRSMLNVAYDYNRKRKNASYSADMTDSIDRIEDLDNYIEANSVFHSQNVESIVCMQRTVAKLEQKSIELGQEDYFKRTCAEQLSSQMTLPTKADEKNLKLLRDIVTLYKIDRTDIF